MDGGVVRCNSFLRCGRGCVTGVSVCEIGVGVFDGVDLLESDSIVIGEIVV